MRLIGVDGDVPLCELWHREVVWRTDWSLELLKSGNAKYRSETEVLAERLVLKRRVNKRLDALQLAELRAKKKRVGKERVKEKEGWGNRLIQWMRRK